MKIKNGVYNAGALFNQAEQKQRIEEGKILRQVFKNQLTIYNPIDSGINQQEELTNKKIFEHDYRMIDDSKYFIFDMDSRDDGTFIEFGIAIHKAFRDPNIHIICNYSDFRIKGEYIKGNWPSYSMNAFVHGACFYEPLIKSTPRQIYITNGFEDSVELLKLLVSGKPFDDRKWVNNLKWPQDGGTND